MLDRAVGLPRLPRLLVRATMFYMVYRLLLTTVNRSNSRRVSAIMLSDLVVRATALDTTAFPDQALDDTFMAWLRMVVWPG